MGMILGHHLPLETIAPAVDTCSFGVHFDGPSPHATNLRFRYDVRHTPDGSRFWTRHGGVSHPAFDSLFQYDPPAPWQLSGWVQTASQPLGNDTFIRTMDWHDEGRKLTFLNRWFSSFRRLDTWDQSATPYDITVLGPVFASRTGIPGAEFLVRFNLEASAGGTSSGSHLFISRSAVRLERHFMPTPHDISTMVIAPDQVFDMTPFGGRADQCGFSADHTRLYAITAAGLLCSWDLTAPDDISAPFNFTTGPNINALPEGINNLGIARGLIVRPDTGDLTYFGDQNNYRVRCWSGGVAPTVDTELSSVVLLLDFAGPDGGTNITDLSPSGHTETFFGNAQIDTLVRSQGNNTLQLDGAGDYITFPDSNDWDFPGDLTIEFTVDMDVISTAQTFMGNYLTGAGDDKGISVEIDASNNLRVLNGDSVLYSEPWAGVAINTSYQIAVTRSGTSLRVFIDGVQLGATVVDSTNFVGSVQPWRIGSLDGAAQFVDGHVGSVRITNGVARYTAGYTPSPCGFASDPVPPSPVVASGAPSITKPTSAGAAVVTSTAAIVAGAPVIGSGVAPQTIPNAPIQSVGDRIFVYGANEVPLVDGTWTALNTAPASFHLFTKIAAGDVTDQAQTQGSSITFAVFIKFTMVDPGGVGVWDFDAQSTLRNTFRTAFDNNSLSFGLGSGPSCAFFAGLRIGSGVQPGVVGDFSDANFNTPPNGGTILKVKTQDPNAPFNTFWHGISFFCEPTKILYATGKKWIGANEPTSHLTQTRGWRYDHD